MSKPRLAIVVTTIGKGDFLDGYCQQAEVEGLRDNLKIIVIPDRKSPNELYKKCNFLVSDSFDIVCPRLSEQEYYLVRFTNLVDLIPYNSDNWQVPQNSDTFSTSLNNV